jgi:ATPase subunit of ABC transporter with duplicated ATPase domains
MSAVLEARNLCIDAPGGRPLIRGLSMSLGRERVALIGRNGVGKSTLVGVLAGLRSPERGTLIRRSEALLVPQELDPIEGMSPGEARRLRLEEARRAKPGLLLLDEPTRDLDERGVRWLIDWLEPWPSAAIVVSHDRRLLEVFGRFCVIAEPGCRAFEGNLAELEAVLEAERIGEQRAYVRRLDALAKEERRNDAIQRRRRRKKNLGRLHEEARMPTSAQLHGNKSYAEASQGKAAAIRAARIEAARTLVKVSRRALAVELPMEVLMPDLPPDDRAPIVTLDGVAAFAGDRALFEDVHLEIRRGDRIGVVGPNGAGKTTLLDVMRGGRRAASGRVRSDGGRIGSIAQGAADWMLDESLLDLLSFGSTLERATRSVVGHRFPLAVADRPLRTLSPGERVRAAFMALLRRSPPVDALILDEPSDSLDLTGSRALADGLRAWPGALVVASHDRSFLALAGVERIVILDRGR